MQDDLGYININTIILNIFFIGLRWVFLSIHISYYWRGILSVSVPSRVSVSGATVKVYLYSFSSKVSVCIIFVIIVEVAADSNWYESQPPMNKRRLYGTKYFF